jgi:hypothetical protein
MTQPDDPATHGTHDAVPPTDRTGPELSTGTTEAASGSDPEVDPIPHTDDGDDPSPGVEPHDAGLV